MEIHIQIIIFLATAFSMISPIIFVAIREAIKRQRQEIITDLATVFDIGDTNSSTLIPSFEFVKYKYFVGVKRSLDPEPARPEVERRILAHSDSHRKREDYSTMSWVIACSPFSVFVGVGMFYALSLCLFLLSAHTSQPDRLIWSGITYPIATGNGIIWLLGISAAFAGSYITALRNLFRAVKNFDLSPQAIVGETIKMLASVVFGPVLAISILWVGSGLISPLMTVNVSSTASASVAIVISICFIAGIMPDVVLRNIVHRDQLKNFKHEELKIYEAFTITPVEIIDGIDSEIRSRLDDHHIHSTQNLAAANPLMLFVETPYGVYQIMDWVAQAQLCCSVGRDKIIELWPLGVRTLFDLERLANGSGDTNQALMLAVGKIILGDKLIPCNKDDPAALAALVKASIELRLDDPHVHRLRQIYIAVGDRLGPKSRRFGRDKQASAQATSI